MAAELSELIRSHSLLPEVGTTWSMELLELFISSDFSSETLVVLLWTLLIFKVLLNSFFVFVSVFLLIAESLQFFSENLDPSCISCLFSSPNSSSERSIKPFRMIFLRFFGDILLRLDVFILFSLFLLLVFLFESEDDNKNSSWDPLSSVYSSQGVEVFILFESITFNSLLIKLVYIILKNTLFYIKKPFILCW